MSLTKLLILHELRSWTRTLSVLHSFRAILFTPFLLFSVSYEADVRKLAPSGL